MKLRSVSMAIAFAAFGLALACSEPSAEEAGTPGKDMPTPAASAEQAMQAGKADVEKSVQTEEKAYDAARQEGESRVDAAGDAYNKVLEEPEKSGAE